jgi:quercetin dioxygenase-like cupin family protein
MSSIQRPLSGDALVFKLSEEARTIQEQASSEHGPASRTLLKSGPLRVTLITLGVGGQIKEHQAEGPITVHVLAGSLEFRTTEQTYSLASGELLSLAPGIRHSVQTQEGTAFLLTIAV